MITGYWPPSSGRNTSARSTVPSAMAIGTSQSIIIVDRLLNLRPRRDGG